MSEHEENIDIKKMLVKAEKRAERREKMRKVGEWCNRNKDVIFFFGALIIPQATRIIVTAIVNGNRNAMAAKESISKDLSCYDRSSGHYWSLCRKPTNAEWTIIESRKADGERLGEILDDMNLLGRG
jgi:hypothetical protein